MDGVSNEELVFAVSTVWVVVAAVLVIFMQAGFAFLEAGLTRMKNVGHVAAKNVLIFALASIVYYVVGFGMAFGDGGNGFVGGSGFVPSTDELLQIGKAPFSWFSEIPAAAAYLFQVAFAGVSLAIVWGAMAERTKLWVYFAFGIAFTLIYSLVSHWIWSPDGWLFARGMQDFAGSTVVHYQGALAGLAGALLLGPRLGRFGDDGRSHPIPGHNMAFTTLGVIILWFGWFGFNAGSTLSVQFGGLGFFAYIALNTNLGAAAGVVGAVVTSWAVMRKPDLSMMLNGAIAGLVA
ncbi:MAG TPA: ammonium transporter, partial [Gaiellaceae bacterium]|nr:ammonium transporter [Gaiellaceae bacterium]